jgi:hypothetical protein
MRVKLCLSIAALLADLACGFPADAASDPKLDQPPAGIVPTTIRLAEILAAHEKAVGAVPAGTPNTVVERWEFVDTGLAGIENLVRSGTDYRSTIEAGPFVERFGQHSGERWHQDANGFTNPTTGVDDRSFYAIRVLEDAADPKNDVTVLGETTGAHPAYVLQVKRPGGHHFEWIFYDKATWQVDRVELSASGRRIVETYDDFRATKGVTQAWHVHDTDGRPELDDDYTLQSLQQGVPVDASAFQPPPHAPTVSRVTQTAAIPAQTHRAGFVVRMMVNGRGLDFLLSSGAERSVIDRDVARDLHLPTFGQTTQLADGKPVSYRTVIADGDVGPIHLHNFVFDSERFVYQPNDSTKVVGTLGSDFFAANVLHFDFENGTLEALPVLGFDQVHPVDGAFDIPLDVDDGTPFVTLRIGDTIAAHSILETSSPYTILFGAFVDEHPAQLEDVDTRIGHRRTVVPFADDGAFGTEAEVWEANVKDFIFAITAYPAAGVVATNYPYTLHGENVEAMVGMDYMCLYDLYFDYPNGRLLLKPNALFHKAFKPIAP